MQQPEVLESKKDQQNQGRDFVKITIDGVSRQIHRGRQTVAEIKTVGGVSLVDELSQVINGKLDPLADDGSVVIKGEEAFVSNRRSGASS